MISAYFYTSRRHFARSCALLVAVTFLLAVPSQASTLLFTDGTFDLANYLQKTYTNNTAAAGATSTLTQSSSSGNPLPSVDFHADWTVNTTWTIFDGLINSGFTFNPASGSISGIDYSLDRNTTFTPGSVVLTNAVFNALLLQAGKFYIDQITGPAFLAGTWQTISATGLQATDFSLYDFTTNTMNSTQHPDFSTAGSAINFGFRTGRGQTSASGIGSFDSLSDNLSITVNAVPEPSSVELTITALVAGLLWHWRRSSSWKIRART